MAFTETIWEWYAVHKRTLPWRDLWDLPEDHRAYRILVSEVMLQQTQVPRVIRAYKRFLEAFPLIEDLARASNRDVLIAWRGMGYNSRALRLRDAAMTIHTRWLVSRCSMRNGERATRERATSNVFPNTIEDLMSIPGIGPYTAAAIRNFAFNLPTSCLDTNIRRILHRTFVGPENADGTWERDDAYLLALAGEVLDQACSRSVSRFSLARSSIRFQTSNKQPANDQHVAADWHAALMDFGSLVQTKKNPKWSLCPLTAKGIMVTTARMFAHHYSKFIIHYSRREPGRMVGMRFVPNRIFRGKIVETLRDAVSPMSVSQIGASVCIDWNSCEHERWLRALLVKLKEDRLIRMTKSGRCELG